MTSKNEEYDKYWSEETTDDPVEDEAMKKEMKTFLSSIYFDAEVPDWREGDTWGDPEDEYVPKSARKYRTSREMLNSLKKSRPTSDATFQGLSIKVETPAGDIRSGVAKDGTPWQTRMIYDYGYISRTEGVDGDHVDVYIGPDESAEYVYVMHQVDPDTGKYDEDKCMLGFGSEESARWSYLRHYDNTRFLGASTAVPMSLFKERLKKKGEPIVPDSKEKVAKAVESGEWPYREENNEDPNLVQKYGTKDGAMKRWRLRKFGLENNLEIAGANRDAKGMIKIRQKIASGERIYKSIVSINELLKDVQ